jgi:putative PIN family toxin of toxin-antitoxin system
MIDLLIRVVIDTNIWISALINGQGAPARLLQTVRDRRIQLILSGPLVSEVDQVVQRQRIRRRIALDDRAIQDFLGTARERAIIVNIGGDLRVCRDPKDDIVIETAIEGGARYVVSRDEDLTRDLGLLEALRAYGIEVLTVARFLELLDAERT